MKNIKNIISLIILVLISTSCLKSGLDDLPVYKDTEILNFRFEYRWYDDAKTQLMVIQIQTDVSIVKATSIVNCILTVPAKDDSKGFTDAIRNQVSLSNIVGYSDISTAASIKPIAGSPVLGIPGDFSKTGLQYEVSAADGSTKRDWNLNITGFNK